MMARMRPPIAAASLCSQKDRRSNSENSCWLRYGDSVVGNIETATMIVEWLRALDEASAIV